MDDILLNRIGILLSVASGFLLAPQWFGVERLKRAERRLEVLVDALHHRLETLVGRLRGKPFLAIKVVLGVLVLLALIVGGFVFGVSRNVMGLVPFEWIRDLFNLGVQVVTALFWVGVIVVCLIIPFALLDGLLRIVQAALGKLARSLAAGDRLTDYMTGYGIVALVAGNLAQYLATFP